MTPQLFPKSRTCVVCNGEAPYNKKRLGRNVLQVLSLSGTVYQRIGRGRRQKAWRAVRVCEPCLATIAAESCTARIKGRILADALLNSILDCYSKLDDAPLLQGMRKRQG